MYLKSKNLLEWRFWYKLLGVLLVITFIVTDYTLNMIDIAQSLNYEIVDPADFTGWEIFNAAGVVVGQDYLGYTLFYLGYFTTQSNILVLIFFIVAIVKHNFNPQTKGHKSAILSRYGSFLITIYILVTGIIYNVILLPVGLARNGVDNPWKEIFLQEIGHGIIPLMMVFYILFININIFKKSSWWPTFFAKEFSLAIIYPIIFLVIGLVRGQLIYSTYTNLKPFENLGREIVNAADYIDHFNIRAYQYFFLDINTTLGKIFMPITLIMILFIILGLGAALTSALNKRVEKLTDPVAYKAKRTELKIAKKTEKEKLKKENKEDRKSKNESIVQEKNEDVSNNIENSSTSNE